AQTMPPAMPATSSATTTQRPAPGPATSTTPVAAIAPRMYCPSAPMFQTLARNAMARPSAIIASGVALIASSLSARPSRSGSTKNIASARAGGLPSAANSAAPIATVIASAASGDSSLATRALLHLRRAGEIPAHPLADLRDARFPHRDARRQPPARHH